MQANLFFHSQLNKDEQENIGELKGNFIKSLDNGTWKVMLKQVDSKKQTLEAIRQLAGNIANNLQKDNVTAAHVDAEELQKTYDTLKAEEVVTAFVEGWHLGSYQFDKYKTKKANQLVKLSFSNTKNIQTFIDQGEVRAAATAFSRDLMNETSTTLNPE